MNAVGLLGSEAGEPISENIQEEVPGLLIGGFLRRRSSNCRPPCEVSGGRHIPPDELTKRSQRSGKV